jgi:hypothetical protein
MPRTDLFEFIPPNYALAIFLPETLVPGFLFLKRPFFYGTWIALLENARAKLMRVEVLSPEMTVCSLAQLTVAKAGSPGGQILHKHRLISFS